MSDDRAYARRSDPETSHEAAAAVTPDLRLLQARVADYAKRKGPTGFTDAELSHDLEDEGSTFRTRRAELTARNIILDCGQRRRWGESTRSRIVWVHRDWVRDAPPVCEAPVPATPEDKAEGRAWAAKLSIYAVSMRKEGRAAFADDLVAAAAVMQKLSA